MRKEYIPVATSEMNNFQAMVHETIYSDLIYS